MKVLFVVLFAFLYAAQGVPSRGVTHDSPTHSVKNDLSDDTFIQEIRDDSLQTYGEYGADPKIETVGYNHEHAYEDFSADIGRYPEYEQFRSFEGFEDVIPRDVRVSGLSLEDQEYKTYSNTDHSDTTEDKQSTSWKLQDAEQDSERLSASAGFGEDLDMSREEFEDVTVEGLSDYSYLVGDKLHGINELRAAGAMNGAHKVMFDVGDVEEFKDFDYDVERDEDLNYDEFLEEEDHEVQDQEDDHGYDHTEEVTTMGQAVEDGDNEEFEEDDFEEDDFEEKDELDGSEGFEDHDYDEDSDAYVEDVDEDDEIDAGVGTTYPDDDGEYDEDEDELDEDHEEDFASRNVEEIQTEARVKGMSVGVSEDDEDEELDDEDEEFDDEHEEFEDEDEDEDEDNLPDTGLPYDEEEDEYEDEYASELYDDDEDDGYWDEREDDFDTTSSDVELDEGVPEVDENEASESLHGDDIMPDIKTEKRK